MALDLTQHLFRRPLLAVAENRRVEWLIRRHGFSNGLVRRFVAGEDLETAIRAVKGIAAQGMTSTLDQLGENVHSREAAIAAAGTYVVILRRLKEEGLEPNISLKLTMLGLDLGTDVAAENLATILTAAREVGGFVCIDMESSAYTDRTLDLTEALHERFPGCVGTVIQSYLRRGEADLKRLIARGIRLRLVKGAYAEAASIAYQRRREIDDAYLREARLLLAEGRDPAFGTHDPALIAAIQTEARERGLGSDRFEFQMLYGVRRDAQAELVRRGWRMRVYVPFGTEWYPYFTRRIAERPANALFVLRQLVSG